MTPYNYSIPVYYYILVPVDDSNLTGPQLAGLIVFCAWLLAVGLVIIQLLLDRTNRLYSDNKQDKKRHTIELIILIAIGIAGVIWLIAY